VPHVLWIWVAIVGDSPMPLRQQAHGLIGSDQPAQAAAQRDGARAAANEAFGRETRIELWRYVWDGQPG
jgi:hypothetical protein